MNNKKKARTGSKNNIPAIPIPKPRPMAKRNVHRGYALYSYLLLLMVFVVSNDKFPEGSLAVASATATATATATTANQNGIGNMASNAAGGIGSASSPASAFASASSNEHEKDHHHQLQLQLHSTNAYKQPHGDLPPELSGSDDLDDTDDFDADQDQDADADADENVLVVATIDGTFYGISQTTGIIKWKSPGDKTDRRKQNPKDNTNDKPKPKTKADNTDDADDTDADAETNALFNPLLSTTTTRTNNKTWRTAAVPSLDGRVYLTLGNNANANSIQHQDQDQDQAQETVTNSVKDLVERAPFMDSRGRFFVSSKRAFAVALNKSTGEVLRVVQASGFGSGSGSGSGSASSPNDVNVFDLEENGGLVWVGRVDYEVTVHDARTGEVDVQFSTSEVLSVEDMIQKTSGTADHGHGHGHGNGHGHGHAQQSSSSRNGHVGKTFGSSMNSKEPILALPTKASVSQSLQEDVSVAEIFPNLLSQTADLTDSISMSMSMSMRDSNIFSTPGGRLAWRDPESGTIQWIARETFDSPVAYAVESSTGSSLGVHIVPDAPLPHLFSAAYLENEIEMELKLSGGDDHDRGGGGSSSSASGERVDHDETVFGALGNGELFAIPLGRRGFGNGYGYPYGRNGLPRVPRLSSTVGGSAKNMNAQMLAKIPPAGHGDWQHGHHSHAHAHGLEKEKEHVGGPGNALAPLNIPQHCDQSSKNFPQCLTEIYGNNMDQYILDQQQQMQQLGALHGTVQLPNPPRQNYGGEAKDQFRAVLTSWIPPAVALAFVISFELGRRERARSEAAKTRQSLAEKDLQASSESVTFRRELSDEELTSHTEKAGVIHVSEEVLGYGGHGTVVYKGKLDGRYVAVKRMLKAYTASADREISLLIESDGHPNVVRYFLKEIRGDFVYLALELCDLNLQDLIISLSKHRLKETIMRQQRNLPPKLSSGVEPALKKTLFEIASGVKHIHSLRIVHRDLKPANILLAKKSRRRSKPKSESEDDAVYEAFQSEMYLPKISDMGLGKQLAGQSSLGFSTFNTSLGAGLSGEQASTIAGAGPGSVGWQAPEVMAQRLSPEAASLDGSSGPPESMLESSPAEMSLHGRTSRSVDIFSLGCIFYCTLLPGSHPFGEWYEREANIMKNRPATDALKEVSVEAWDLVVSMLNRNPKGRPTASQICQHPFFWSASHRLTFICEFSDRLESENEPGSGDFDRLLIERQASVIVGRQWDSRIDNNLLNNVQKFRTYDTSSVRDCLRLIRNKHHHFEELPPAFRAMVPNQRMLLEYFESKFPRLLMHCYTTCQEQMNAGDLLAIKYAIPCKPQKAILPQLNKTSPVGLNDKSTNHQPPLTVNEDEGDSQISFTNPSASLHSANLSRTITQTQQPRNNVSQEIISWQGSTTASELNCRGWIRSEDEWIHMTNERIKKRDSNLIRCAEDSKYRTRLCNHWDVSQGTHCPMFKKNKCVFAHGPAELRVKEGKKKRWGRLVDANGNNSNPQHSGGEDTYGAAKQIENSRKLEGKWKANTSTTPRKKTRVKKKKLNANV